MTVRIAIERWRLRHRAKRHHSRTHTAGQQRFNLYDRCPWCREAIDYTHAYHERTRARDERQRAKDKAKRDKQRRKVERRDQQWREDEAIWKAFNL